MRKLLVFAFGLLVAACGEGQDQVSTYRFIEDNENLSGTVSAIQNFPEDNAVNVPVDTEFRITFSGPINADQINNFNFRVEDEFGFEVPGSIRMSNGDKTITFRPETRDRQFSLNPGRVYLIRSRFLRDRSNRLIGDYSWKIRTVDEVENTGSFKVTSILPEETLIFPGATIAVRFNEEIMPPDDTASNCSRVQWADSFQVLLVQLIDDDGNTNITPMQGEVCIKRTASTGKFDVLQFFPINPQTGQAGLPENSYVDISIKPSAGLKGSVSGQGLTESHSLRVFVMPEAQDVINFLFPDFQPDREQ